MKQINKEGGYSPPGRTRRDTQTLSICNCACVLENGRIVLEDLGDELLNNEHVKKAYLGI